MVEAPPRTVSLLVAGLAGVVLLLVGGIAGYAIGNSGGHDRPAPGVSRHGGPGPHARPDFPHPPRPGGQGRRPNTPPAPTPSSATPTSAPAATPSS
ncbi:hypothetical protein Aglo01_22580 [Actinokineospora globicatena]|nr:hypothetical protein Aglo01_22580 [Actinokineospora globicatena]GLW85556.1 hypothetical protein Aglo02_31960 [Actinokineospora globicatena]